MATPRPSWKLVACNDILNDRLFSVVRYMDYFRDHLEARRFAVMRLSGMRKLFVMNGMVRSVTPLWVLERNVDGITAVLMRQT